MMDTKEQRSTIRMLVHRYEMMDYTIYQNVMDTKHQTIDQDMMYMKYRSIDQKNDTKVSITTLHSIVHTIY